MIRFRIGQNWKSEALPAQGPLDAFGLDLDGIDLLSGAGEEALTWVVPALLEAVSGLVKGKERAGQVSLLQAELELCLMRQGVEQLELSVVSLSRPTRLVRPPVTLELSELAHAAGKVATALIADLAESAPEYVKGTLARALQRRAKELEACTPQQPPEIEPGQWSYQRFERPGAVGLALRDVDGRLSSWHRKATASLPPLLVGGELTCSGWTSQGPPFLLVLELARQATGLTDSAEVPLGNGVTTSPRAIFELGLELCFALRTRDVGLASNPHVTALADRCAEGLSALRVAMAPPLAPASAPRTSKRASGKPLPGPGALRRLRFEAKWEKVTPGPESSGQLLLSGQGPVVATRHAALGFSGRGKVLFRRLDTLSVAASADGRVLAFSNSRVALYCGNEPQARWVRDHDGVAVEPTLIRKDGLLIGSIGRRGVIAFSELTGRELWRLDPPRAQTGAVSVQGHRVLLATDTGALYGIELADGQVRFKVRASLPFPVAPVPFGKRALAVLARGDRAALFAADLHTGNLTWTRELALERPSSPAVAHGRIFVAGRRSGRHVLACLNTRGQLLWERLLPLEATRVALLAVDRGVVAQDARGAAAYVSRDGQIEWVLGSAGDELPNLVPPVLSRGVVLLAGHQVRAVEPRGGRVLAELDAGLGLTDLKADARLNLYLLTENGALRAFALKSHFAVV